MTRRHAKRHPAPPRRRRGFTLIELLVAISILAIVAVLGWRGLDGIIRSRAALTAQMEQTRGLQLAFAQMQNDLEQLATTAQLHGRVNLQALDGRITLVRTSLAENEPSRLQVVSYRLRDGVLVRRESAATRDLVQLSALWQAALGDADPAASVALQSGVDSLTMRIWQNNGWQSAANANQSAPPPSPLLTSIVTGPTGLEVSLRLAGQNASLIKVFLLGAV
ncbi:prepilin-type N-terminal cleavage/methylation domain-containing protein [Rugamonas sp.]|uniref:prepilin-type N-terminal cleavage/methylation domain-containing protein n=1 Tax=Rugamonas sp. TaxID=1926287 RepID=UPI0025CBCEE0|nr:prepilin-type N-terminal cleavage/methylation domain-containing protein [Rugamonas sp.]